MTHYIKKKLLLAFEINYNCSGLDYHFISNYKITYAFEYKPINTIVKAVGKDYDLVFGIN